jgi:hypothetical protein
LTIHRLNDQPVVIGVLILSGELMLPPALNSQQ